MRPGRVTGSSDGPAAFGAVVAWGAPVFWGGPPTSRNWSSDGLGSAMAAVKSTVGASWPDSVSGGFPSAGVVSGDFDSGCFGSGDFASAGGSGSLPAGSGTAG